MKTISSFVSVLFLVIMLVSCEDVIHHKNIKEKLENPEERIEIFEAICSDKEYIKHFSTYMVDNNYHEEILRHPKMMRHMMSNKEQMIQIMKNDTSMCKRMMDSMMEISNKDSISCNMMCNSMMKNKHMMNIMKGAEIKGRRDICCPMHKIMNPKEMR